MSSVLLYQTLRAKAGEASGLAAVPPRVKCRVRTMFDFPHIEEVNAAANQCAMFAMTLASSWGTEVPLYLDLSRFDPDLKTAAGVPLVTHLFNAARQAHIKAIPVTASYVERKGKTGAYLQGVAEAARRDGRGAAIRIPFQDLATPEELPSLIDELQRAIGLDDSQCDVFLDAGPTDSLPGGQAAAYTLLRESIPLAAEALAHRSFRAMIFSSSSIPKMTRGKGAHAPSKIPNVEFQVWSEMQNSKSLRHIRFGDYGPRFAYQTDKRAKARAPARIHLTTDRSHSLHVASGSLYRELARSAAQSEEFAAQRGRWGKFAVRDAGLGNGNVGNSTEWVARDVEMHIETLVHAVESRIREISGAAADERFDEEIDYGQQHLPMS